MFRLVHKYENLLFSFILKQNLVFADIILTRLSVSFQQSSIHAVRSFSASFPGRRCSMATSLFLNGNTYNQPTNNNNAQKIQEKRAPVNELEDEESVPKRRLLRTKSAPIDKR